MRSYPKRIAPFLCYTIVMKDLKASVNDLRTKYREIFLQSANEIEKRVEEIKPDNANTLFEKYDKNSEGYKWQQDVINMLDRDISKEIYRKWSEILAYREQFDKDNFIKNLLLDNFNKRTIFVELL